LKGLACWRFVPVNRPYLRQRFAGRPAPTGELHLVFVGACLQANRCRSTSPRLRQRFAGRPAPTGGGAGCLYLWELACKRMVPVTSITSGNDSPAGRLLQGEALAACICGSLPASESLRATSIAAGKNSPAGRLLQGKKLALYLWELACKRIVPGQLASPQAKIRRQAGSYKGKSLACICGSLPASESLRATNITSGENSPAGRLLQGKKLALYLWELACKRIAAAPQASPQSNIRRPK
jgi:hypothetical protein